MREAIESDIDFTWEVRRRAFRPIAQAARAWDESVEEARHRERFGRLRYRLIVADGTEIGYVATSVRSEDGGSSAEALFLHQLMLLPEHQGRGIGSACLREVVSEARGVTSVRLQVLRVNHRARAFFVAAGFVVTDESVTHWHMRLVPR